MFSPDIKTGLTKDKEEATAILREEGYANIYEWSDQPGSRYGWHTHPEDEVRWILSGSITIGTEETEHTLNPGERLNVPAETRHYAHTETGVTYLCASR